VLPALPDDSRREDHHALMPVCSHCSYAEKEVVDHDAFQGELLHISHVSGVLPDGGGGIAPINLVSHSMTFSGFLPAKFRGSFHNAAYLHLFRCRRGPGEAGKIDGIYSGEVGGVIKIHVFHDIAISYSIFRPAVLVLLGVIFVCFHDPDPRKPKIVKRAVMSSAAKAVQTVDHHRIHIRHVLLRRLVNIPCQLSRDPVDLSAIETSSVTLLFGLGWRYGL